MTNTGAANMDIAAQLQATADERAELEVLASLEEMTARLEHLRERLADERGQAEWMRLQVVQWVRLATQARDGKTDLERQLAASNLVEGVLWLARHMPSAVQAPALTLVEVSR